MMELCDAKVFTVRIAPPTPVWTFSFSLRSPAWLAPSGRVRGPRQRGAARQQTAPRRRNP